MLINDIIGDVPKDERFKSALEERATHPLTDLGKPTCSVTWTVHLAAGKKTVRLSVAMIDEGEMFAEDLD